MAIISNIRFEGGTLPGVLSGAVGRTYLILGAYQNFRLVAENTTTEVSIDFLIGTGVPKAVSLALPTIPSVAGVGFMNHLFPVGGVLTSENTAITLGAVGGAPAVHDCGIWFRQVEWP